MTQVTSGRATLPASAVPTAPEIGLALFRGFRSHPLDLFLTASARYGPIVRFRTGGRGTYLLSEPAAIQDALVRTNRGYVKGIAYRKDPGGPGFEPLARVLGRGLLTSPPAVHRRQRRLMQPLFHHERVAEYGDTFAAIAEEAAQSWVDGGVRPMHREMTELTMAMVARTVFDVDLDSEVIGTVREAIELNQRTLRRSTMPGGRLLNRLPVPSTLRWNADQRRVDAIVYRMIAERRAAGADGHDLLSLLLSARDEDTGEPMADTQVRDEAMTLLLAGHETTANALTWTCYLLGRHPAEQERLQAELDDVLGPDRRLPTAGDLPSLTYTTAVLRESMRLFPPAWLTFRRLAADREVCGYQLPTGSLLLMPPWVVHRDPRWWPNPGRFDPRRWLAGNGDAGGDGDRERPRFAYFPFGGGPRQCIGNTFAEMEAVLTLATLLRRWTVRPAWSRPVRLVPLITLRPAGGVPMTVHARR